MSSRKAKVFTAKGAKIAKELQGLQPERTPVRLRSGQATEHIGNGIAAEGAENAD